MSVAQVSGVLAGFQPAVRTWFESRFNAPTDAQEAGWPPIRSGQNTLLAAPTGSGKTLAAFLSSIDDLVARGSDGELADETTIVYVSPLKALGNDIGRNLDEPLAGIRDAAREMGLHVPEIRSFVRTGDTAQAARQAMIRRPPHILITTPESLYLLLTAQKGRESLRTVRTVIVDEIHALARDRRGSHLALSLARLDHIAHAAPQRIGLSATQRPLDEIGRFLVGAGSGADCEIVDLGHQRDIELAVEVPPSDLEAVASREQWGDIYDRLAALIESHKTSLLFVNTRSLAERVAHNLAERIGEDCVASHHGSLARERRLSVEQRLKDGNLKALVATASLELGIDIGSIDLVCQIGSPRGIATFLQRVGRSGHSLGLRPHGRLFPTSRDELVECATLIRAARAGRLDRIVQPVAPLDVLAQQIVAECACEDWNEDAVFDLIRRATPFAGLDRKDYDEVVEMLAVGLGGGAGRAPRLLHHDRINKILRGRRGARMTALTNCGTIPETGDYAVIAEPDEMKVGSVNEDFAMESMAGDIFLLGSTSWRIQRVTQGTVRVVDAQGAPPTIPFWLGEAPGRTVELSEEVGRLRQEVAAGLKQPAAVIAMLREQCALSEIGAEQLVEYVRASADALGRIPTATDVVFERFFDETGGMQLVVHAPFGQRINRAWGLALRKHFCVKFDFELHAAANDNAFILSLGPQHSFPLEETFSYLKSGSVTKLVEQAILYTPLFPTRWRWNATRALAILRQRGGKRVPPFLQRMRGDDLMAAVFPDQVGCQENVTGPLELPDHPLIRQTVHDCLHEAMDVDGLVAILRRIEAGEIRLHAVDTAQPSPMAHEVVSGRPYTYLDDAPIEERRTRAVSLRRVLPDGARELGALDVEAIRRVAEEAWPQPRDAEEVHDALLGLVAIDEGFVEDWRPWLQDLLLVGRAHSIVNGPARVWFAAENINLVEMLFPVCEFPQLELPDGVVAAAENREDALVQIVRGHTEILGPTTVAGIHHRTSLDRADIETSLLHVESGGFILRGSFTPDLDVEEFCDRRLLARIHRYTLERLRKEIAPVSARDFMRFLVRWQYVAPETRLEGREGIRRAVSRLEGFEAPASAWERDLLPARVRNYRPGDLDDLCFAGEIVWARLSLRRPVTNGNGSAEKTTSRTAATRATPVTLARREDLPDLLMAVRGYASDLPPDPEVGAAGEVLQLLNQRGALFFDEITSRTRRLKTDVEQGLRELIGAGFVTSDGFQGLRAVAQGQRSNHRLRAGRSRSNGTGTAGPPGRWAAIGLPDHDSRDDDDRAEKLAEVLLDRYGVLFRDLMQRESFTMPWRYVLKALRRLEARGEVRGGRFVAGFVGEQYALPAAVQTLRDARRQPSSGDAIRIGAADPLNLTGIVISGPRTPSHSGETITLVDGLPAPANSSLEPAGASVR